MFTIQNSKQLAVAYVLLRYYEKGLKDPNQRDKELVEENVQEVKMEIRRFYRKQQAKQKIFGNLVKDYGIDGYIVLEELPEDLQSMEDAEAYFDETMKMTWHPSPFDCTGQLFTSWHKIIRRRNRFMVYHRVARDC